MMSSRSSRRKPSKVRKIDNDDKEDVENEEEDENDDAPVKTSRRKRRTTMTNGNSIPEDLPEGTVIVEPEEVNESVAVFTGPEFSSRKGKMLPGEYDSVSCTSCSSLINQHDIKSMKRHPVLKVLICKKCYRYYCSDDFDKDSNGLDEQCRWCGDGGNLLCCDFCSNAFCKACIKRNLGRSELSNITEADDNTEWKCYVCKPLALASLIASCTAIMDRAEMKQMGIKSRKQVVSDVDDSDIEVESDALTEVIDELYSIPKMLEEALDAIRTDVDSLKSIDNSEDLLKKKKIIVDKLNVVHRSIPKRLGCIKSIGKRKPAAITNGNTGKKASSLGGGQKTIKNGKKSDNENEKSSSSSHRSNTRSSQKNQLKEHPKDSVSDVSDISATTFDKTEKKSKNKTEVVNEEKTDKVEKPEKTKASSNGKADANIKAKQELLDLMDEEEMDVDEDNDQPPVEAHESKAHESTESAGDNDGSSSSSKSRKHASKKTTTFKKETERSKADKTDNKDGENSVEYAKTEKDDKKVKKNGKKVSSSVKKANVVDCKDMDGGDDKESVNVKKGASKSVKKSPAISDSKQATSKTAVEHNDDELEENEFADDHVRKSLFKEYIEKDSDNQKEEKDNKTKKDKNSDKTLQEESNDCQAVEEHEDVGGGDDDEDDNNDDVDDNDDVVDDGDHHNVDKGSQSDESKDIIQKQKPKKANDKTKVDKEDGAKTSTSKENIESKNVANVDESSSSSSSSSSEDDPDNPKDVDFSVGQSQQINEKKTSLTKKKKSKKSLLSASDEEKSDDDFKERSTSRRSSKRSKTQASNLSKKFDKLVEKNCEKKEKQSHKHDSDSSDYDSDLERDIEKLAKAPTKSRRKLKIDVKDDGEPAKEEKEEVQKEEKKAKKKSGQKKVEIIDKSKEADKSDLSSLSEKDGDSAEDAVEEAEDDLEVTMNIKYKTPENRDNENARQSILDEMENENDDDDDDDISDDDSVLESDDDKKKTNKKSGDHNKKKNKISSSSDGSGTDVQKKNKNSKKSRLLTVNLSDSDSNAKTKKEKKRKQKSSDDDEYSKSSDDNQSDDNNDSDSSSDSMIGLKRKKRKRSRSDDGDLSDTGKSRGKGGKEKKRRRIKMINLSSEEDDGDVDDSDEEPRGKKKGKKKSEEDDGESGGEGDDIGTPGKHRKKIRKMIKKSRLEKTTKDAAKAEDDRKQRIAAKQKLYNESLITEAAGDGSCPITTKLVLEMNEETKEPIIGVNKDLIRHLKPHQVDAVRFMYDCVVENIDQHKETGGSGCILAHCMGLGKTLSVITLVHTLLDHYDELQLKRCMVMCPLNTVINWSHEWDKWIEKDEDKFEVYNICHVKQNLERSRMLRDWHKEGGVLIIGYEMFRNLSRGSNCRNKKLKAIFRETLVDPGPDIVVCDEGHLLKNAQSNLAICCNEIKSKRRIVLTGTPLQNNLNEYHCMVSFVKPSLLGTKREFLNRFVNPIINGSCADSTLRDVKVMKKRAHVLYEMLNGCVQRKDYAALTKYLPPKFEYVISVRMSPLQMDLYQKYLEHSNYQDGEGGYSTVGKGARLFGDFQKLMQIWTHPWVLKMDEVRQQNKRLFDDESSFIDEDSESEMSLSDSTSEDEKKKNSSSDNSGSEASEKPSAKNKKQKTRSTRNSRQAANSSGDEVVNKWESKRSRGEADGVEDIFSNGPLHTEWWHPFVTDDMQNNVELSGKLIILCEILRMAEELGDKVLLFSQSLLSLDIIQNMLEHVSNIPDNKIGGTGSWVEGADYFRLDGSTQATVRQKYCDNFNAVDNLRARLFMISTRAGSLGINLVAANRVVIFDASWNPSYDLQAMFRSYRFGQNKPVYVYRLIAQGTMEEKIYERQVNKQSLSQRVVDEHQIQRHFNAADLAELYAFKPDRLDDPNREEKTPILPKDRFLADLLQEQKDWIVQYHEHDSLLENKVDEGLSEEDRQTAWEEYEAEKKGLHQQQETPYLNYNPNFQTMINQMQSANMTQNVLQNMMAGGTRQPQVNPVIQTQLIQLLLRQNPNLTPMEISQRLQAIYRLQMNNQSQEILAQQELHRRQYQDRQQQELLRLQQIQIQQQRQQLLQQGSSGVRPEGANLDDSDIIEL